MSHTKMLNRLYHNGQPTHAYENYSLKALIIAFLLYVSSVEIVVGGRKYCQYIRSSRHERTGNTFLTHDSRRIFERNALQLIYLKFSPIVTDAFWVCTLIYRSEIGSTIYENESIIIWIMKWWWRSTHLSSHEGLRSASSSPCSITQVKNKASYGRYASSSMSSDSISYHNYSRIAPDDGTPVVCSRTTEHG